MERFGRETFFPRDVKVKDLQFQFFFWGGGPKLINIWVEYKFFNELAKLVESSI